MCAYPVADARAIAEKILRIPASYAWKPWTATLAELPDAESHAVDHVVVTYFAAPRSYTAEDVVEISCHGSPVVLRHALERACDAGARLAEPGEFTLRAYLNGRIDLPQAEAVRDLIDATTLYQARIAAQQAEGSVSRRMKPLKEQLLELIALLEAGIDFAEDDISVAPAEEILRRLDPIVSGVAALIAQLRLRQTGSRRIHARHRGPSERRQEQPVQPAAGTEPRHRHRDSRHHARPGFRNRFARRHSSEVRRHRRNSPGPGPGGNPGHRAQLSGHGRRRSDAGGGGSCPRRSRPKISELIRRARGSRARCLVAGNKSDLAPAAIARGSASLVSALTGAGVAELRTRLVDAIAPRGRLEQEGGFITSLRHEQLLKESREALEQARNATVLGIPHEMLLLDLYAALRPIDAITGATTADDILNRIFSTFCIGK